MENDTAVNATSYVLIRVVVIAVFGALFYRVLTRPAALRTVIQRVRTRVRTKGMIRADTVREDRC